MNVRSTSEPFVFRVLVLEDQRVREIKQALSGLLVAGWPSGAAVDLLDARFVRLHWATTLVEALEILRSFQPHMLLLDFRVPVGGTIDIGVLADRDVAAAVGSLRPEGVVINGGLLVAKECLALCHKLGQPIPSIAFHSSLDDEFINMGQLGVAGLRHQGGRPHQVTRETTTGAHDYGLVRTLFRDTLLGLARTDRMSIDRPVMNAAFAHLRAALGELATSLKGTRQGRAARQDETAESSWELASAVASVRTALEAPAGVSIEGTCCNTCAVAFPESGLVERLLERLDDPQSLDEVVSNSSSPIELTIESSLTRLEDVAAAILFETTNSDVIHRFCTGSYWRGRFYDLSMFVNHCLHDPVAYLVQLLKRRDAKAFMLHLPRLVDEFAASVDASSDFRDRMQLLIRCHVALFWPSLSSQPVPDSLLETLTGLHRRWFDGLLGVGADLQDFELFTKVVSPSVNLLPQKSASIPQGAWLDRATNLVVLANSWRSVSRNDANQAVPELDIDDVSAMLHCLELTVKAPLRLHSDHIIGDDESARLAPFAGRTVVCMEGARTPWRTYCDRQRVLEGLGLLCASLEDDATAGTVRFEYRALDGYSRELRLLQKGNQFRGRSLVDLFQPSQSKLGKAAQLLNGSVRWSVWARNEAGLWGKPYCGPGTSGEASEPSDAPISDSWCVSVVLDGGIPS